MKKKYQKPLLTVLVRTRPEESVLDTGCKTTAGGGPGATGDIACTINGCDQVDGS